MANSFDEVLYKKIIANSNVSTALGNAVYIDEAEQGVKLPYCVFFKLASPRNVPSNFICADDGGVDAWQFDLFVDNSEIDVRLNARETREILINAVRDSRGIYENYSIDWVTIAENDVSGIDEHAFRLTFTATIKWTKNS